MDDLVLTKSLSGDYKVQMPHVEVVKKMKERNPGSEPQVGSRVPFVILKNNSTRLFDKAEDPGWVNEKNLKLDYQYYFEHQLEKPIRDLMQPIIGSDRDLFSKVRNQKITSFFIKKMDPDINNDI
jgi:DNA polymerase delta subunit 1